MEKDGWNHRACHDPASLTACSISRLSTSCFPPEMFPIYADLSSLLTFYSVHIVFIFDNTTFLTCFFFYFIFMCMKLPGVDDYFCLKQNWFSLLDIGHFILPFKYFWGLFLFQNKRSMIFFLTWESIVHLSADLR